jgi:hypothetical protein
MQDDWMPDGERNRVPTCTWLALLSAMLGLGALAFAMLTKYEHPASNISLPLLLFWSGFFGIVFGAVSWIGTRTLEVGRLAIVSVVLAIIPLVFGAMALILCTLFRGFRL